MQTPYIYPFAGWAEWKGQQRLSPKQSAPLSFASESTFLPCLKVLLPRAAELGETLNMIGCRYCCHYYHDDSYYTYENYSCCGDHIATITIIDRIVMVILPTMMDYFILVLSGSQDTCQLG